jgi:hypothetical protein
MDYFTGDHELATPDTKKVECAETWCHYLHAVGAEGPSPMCLRRHKGGSRKRTIARLDSRVHKITVFSDCFYIFIFY